MRSFIILFATMLLISCKNQQENWTPDKVSTKCFEEATKGKYNLADNQLKKIRNICNCVSKKMIEKFKTEKEANEKPLEAAELAIACKGELEQTEID